MRKMCWSKLKNIFCGVKSNKRHTDKKKKGKGGEEGRGEEREGKTNKPNTSFC